MSRIKSYNSNYRFPIAMICLLQFMLCNFIIAQAPHSALIANAGNDTIVCSGDSVKIGGNPSATGGIAPYTYSWQPAALLDVSTSANPKAAPTSQTSYILTVTDSAGNSSSDSMQIFTKPPPTLIIGPDQTIIQGETAQLQASGAVQYFWYPAYSLTNDKTATPTAEPYSTTTYCVFGIGNNGCGNTTCMTVHVIPSDTLIFYNAFSPNADGNNDLFYIGNLESFPENKVEIYNRNGKLVYQASPYHNNWDGKIDGAELPCATYYFIVYPGKGKPNREGAVTIIR